MLSLKNLARKGLMGQTSCVKWPLHSELLMELSCWLTIYECYGIFKDPADILNNVQSVA